MFKRNSLKGLDIFSVFPGIPLKLFYSLDSFVEFQFPFPS